MESKKRRIIQSEGRRIIASVYHYLKDEYEFTLAYNEPSCDLSHLKNISKRTAEATGVGTRTVQKVLQEEKNLPSSSSKFPTPLKNRRTKPHKGHIDAVTADAVRCTIQNFHLIQNQIPNLTKLRSVLGEIIGFDGCLNTLKSILKKLGFNTRIADNKKRILVERHDIQMLRLKYLKKISDYRALGWPIVYIDASYTLKTDVKHNALQNPNSSCTRFVLVNAGSDAGFIENASLVYKANLNDITYEEYVKWLNENLMPNLPENSVIILDNEFPHHARSDKVPTSASAMSEMQEWLTDKGIQFDPYLRKVEIYDIVKQNKNNFVTFKVDQLIQSKGFEVLRLPPYHPELNAIQHMYVDLKKHFELQKNDQNFTDTESLVKACMEKITKETWRDICSKVIKKEYDYLQYFDAELELIKHLRYDTDEESETDYESDEN